MRGIRRACETKPRAKCNTSEAIHLKTHYAGDFGCVSRLDGPQNIDVDKDGRFESVDYVKMPNGENRQVILESHGGMTERILYKTANGKIERLAYLH